MSVQDATAAVNVELHRHFDRSASSGLKPPLQKSFGGKFVQGLVATVFYDFDFIHFATPGFIVSRKSPLPSAMCNTTPGGYSGSTFLIKPGGVPVCTCASKPRRYACVDDKPACSAIKLITVTFSQRS